MSELSRQLPPLGTLVVFDAAVRLGSFSLAADECALSQASVSRQIRQLEDNLGVRLFERLRHNVVPTTAGEEFATSVRHSLLELAASSTNLRSIANERASFTIFSDISLASSVINPLLFQFQQDYPETQFHILSTYEPIEKTTKAFDIGLQVGMFKNDLFDIEAIGDDQVYPVCSPTFAKKLGAIENLNANQLASLPLLHLDFENKDWPDWKEFLSTFNGRLPDSRTKLMFSSYQVILDVAERGEGIALGWDRSVANLISDGKLIRLTDMSIHQPNGICAYMRKHSQHHKFAHEIINKIRESIKPTKYA